jgi:hypothetical protein
MSQPCAIADCKRTSRALCHCCQQDLCREHLNEHDDFLNEQLNPFADEINQLSDQINHIDVKSLRDRFREQLNQYRIESYRKIDRYVDEKQRQLDEFINAKLNNQIESINHVKTIIKHLIDNQDTTTKDLNSISSSIQSIRREISQFEYKSIQLNINPLEIDDRLIQIEDENIKRDFNLSTLMPPVHVINRPPENSKPLISNNRVLLTHHENQLCLLNQDMTIIKSIPWPHGWIWDMCWSTTLSRFFIITLTEIFTLNENSMVLEHIVTKDNHSLCSCTCSDVSFYVTTNELGSTVCEFSLLPTIELINRWQPADFCGANEMIQDMVFHKGTLAFIIDNQTTSMKRMELRLVQTFEQLWSIQFDLVDPLHTAYRLCLFNYNEWIVIDWKSAQLFYISKDGQIKSTCVYEPVPYRCCQFGSNILAISARNSINFHRI